MRILITARGHRCSTHIQSFTVSAGGDSAAAVDVPEQASSNVCSMAEDRDSVLSVAAAEGCITAAGVVRPMLPG